MTPRLRSHVVALILAVCATPATAQTWGVVGQAGGYQVARVDGAGAVAGLGLTCEKGAPVMALRLVRPAPRNPAAATLAVGSYSARLAVIRNGATDVWVSTLHDRVLLDAVAAAPAGAKIAVTIDGGQSASLSLDGVRDAMQRALASCYRMSAGVAARQPAAPQRTMADETSLPTPLRQDLADFRASCAAWKFSWDGVPRGQPLIEAGWLNRADFNGDGVADYLVDARKWRCSKEETGGYPGPHLMAYTSQADGSYLASLDVPAITSFRIVPGAKAAGIRIHVDASKADEEGPAIPARDETLTMTGPTAWTPSPSGSATPNWRLGKAGRHPATIEDLFGEWDRQCTATGRRLANPRDAINDTRVIEVAGKTRTLPIDLNADGKRDYVLDTSPVLCGPFGSNPQPHLASTVANGVLIAVLSQPDGSFTLSPIPKSISLQGNGDPAEIEHVGTRDAICFFEDAMSNGPARMVRYTWTGGAATRTVLPQNVRCNGTRY